MDIMNLIDDKTILIMPNEIKIKVLKNNKKLISIKTLTKNELTKKIFFDYDEKTLFYMINKYNLKVDVAVMYLKNMYYIEDEEYDSNKLNELVKMKKDLENHNLIIKNKFLIESLKDSNVIVYGYDYIDSFFKKMLDIISKYATVKIIDNKELKSNDIKIYEFNNLEEEVNFIANSICKLIQDGININNIKLGNITEEYFIPIKKIFSFYNIPINLDDNYNLYGTKIAQVFIEEFKITNSLDESLNKLTKIYNMNDSNNALIYNMVVNICNKYIWYNKDIDNIIKLIINDFKNTKINNPKVTNAVEVIDLKNNIIEDNNYVFLMNFNQGSMPIIHKNEDYITDDLASALGLETTSEKNEREIEVCLNIVKRLSNVIITYKLKTKDQEYYPSSLINYLNVSVIKNFKPNVNISYSSIQDEIALSKKLDKLVKYDELESDIAVLYYNYPNILYKTYNNSFRGLNNSNLLEYLKPKLRLSYSAIDDYFKCAFKYYINYVMKLRDREEKFHLTIGNLFHYVLSQAFTDNFDFGASWNEALKGKELSAKESFFLTKLRTELKFVIDVINSQNKLSMLDKALYEERIYINLPHKIDVTFSGVIDKIMYKEEDNTLISLVDYKTGNTDINLDSVIHGLNMQLPVYLYLVKNSHKFNNPKFIGFYLQEILHNEIYKDSKKDYETIKSDALRLKGYTIDQEELISKFDSSYLDSRVIKSMKVGNNGFYQYSKVLNTNQIDNLIELVSHKIDEGVTNILDGKFDINPKSLNGKNLACEFCELRDMCYMKDNDITILKEQKYSDFLGGTDNE
ncbi:MAG: PD-(D/E)XK nuclease family protein [Bacilli bacterium]|nr:PD-(D/E)XK nuclease family protein [Bacilli bacterium]